MSDIMYRFEKRLAEIREHAFHREVLGSVVRLGVQCGWYDDDEIRRYYLDETGEYIPKRSPMVYVQLMSYMPEPDYSCLIG